MFSYVIFEMSFPFSLKLTFIATEYFTFYEYIVKEWTYNAV